MDLIGEFCSETSVEITNTDELFPASLQRPRMISSVIPPPPSISSTGWRDKLPRPLRRQEGLAAICGSAHRVSAKADAADAQSNFADRQTNTLAHPHAQGEKPAEVSRGVCAKCALGGPAQKWMSCVGADECVEQGWVDWVDWVVGASGESLASTQPLYK